MVKVDWLDRLTFREIEMINEVGGIPFLFQNIFSQLSKSRIFLDKIYCQVPIGAIE